MQIETVKELLSNFCKYMEKENGFSPKGRDSFIQKYIDNNLALGKPEPLAKNKQFDNACDKCDGTGLMRQELISTCNRCYGSGKKQA